MYWGDRGIKDLKERKLPPPLRRIAVLIPCKFSFWRETSQSPGTLIVDQLTNNRPTDRPTDRSQRNQNTDTIGHGGVDAPLTILEVWQNLAIFGGRPIGGAVEALLNKVINRKSSVSPIVVFLLPPATPLLAW